MLDIDTQLEITAWDEMGWGIKYPDYEDMLSGKGSWGQIWLSFVMKEKYNKSWKGETWVEESCRPSEAADSSGSSTITT